MSAFGFSLPPIGDLASGLQDLGERFSKIRDGLGEALDASLNPEQGASRQEGHVLLGLDGGLDDVIIAKSQTEGESGRWEADDAGVPRGGDAAVAAAAPAENGGMEAGRGEQEKGEHRDADIAQVQDEKKEAASGVAEEADVSQVESPPQLLILGSERSESRTLGDSGEVEKAPVGGAMDSGREREAIEGDILVAASPSGSHKSSGFPDSGDVEGGPSHKSNTPPPAKDRAPPPPPEPSTLDHAALVSLVLSLRESLAAREAQLERKAGELAAQAAAAEQLVQRNEELQLQRAPVSEADVDSVQRDWAARVSGLERRVYALRKERDALQKTAMGAAAKDAVIREKEEIVAQVLHEGEALSKRQLAQETTIKSLRAQLREREAAAQALQTKAAEDAARLAGAEQERAALALEAASLREQAAADLASERASSAAAAAAARERSAAASESQSAAAAETAGRRLAESRAEIGRLAERLAAAAAAAEDARAAADEREEMLQREVAELQRRCLRAEAPRSSGGAEAEQLVAQLADAQARERRARDDAREREDALRARLEREREERAREEGSAQAARRESALVEQRVLELDARLAEVQAARAQAAEALSRAGAEAQRRAEELQAAREAGRAARTAMAGAEALAAERLAALAAREESSSARARRAEEALREAGERVQALQARLAEVEEGQGGGVALAGAGQLPTRVGQLPTRAGQPPALAGPGLVWMLVPETQAGEEKGEQAENGSFADPALWRSKSLWPAEGGRAPADEAAAADAARLRSELRRASRALVEAEGTRDRLVEELVSASTSAAMGETAREEAHALRAAGADLQRRCDTCLEMLGEKDERIEELLEDLEDSKVSYREQIELMANELMKARAKLEGD